MEILLSFDYESKNRKKELLFQYNNSPIISTYSFLYQRDCIALDVKYLRDLVAIYKKATRSFCITENYFVSHQEPLHAKNNNYIVFKNPYSIYRKAIKDKDIFLIPIKHIKEHYGTKLAYPVFKHHLSKFENVIGYNKGTIKNIILKDRLFIYMMNIYTRSKMSKFENVYVYNRSTDKKMNRMDPIFLNKDHILNRFDNFILYDNQRIKHLYRNLETILLSMPDNKGLYDDIYHLRRVNEYYHINANISLNSLLYSKNYDISYFDSYTTIYKNYPYRLDYISNYSGLYTNDKRLIYESIHCAHKNINITLNVFENFNVIYNISFANYLNNIYTFNKDNMRMNLHENYFANTDSNFIINYYTGFNDFNKKSFLLNTISEQSFLSSFNNNLFILNNSFISKTGKHSFSYEIKSFYIKNHRSYLNVFRYDFISKYAVQLKESKNEFIDNVIKYVHEKNIYSWIHTIYKNIKMHESNDMFMLVPKYTYVYPNNTFFIKTNQFIKIPSLPVFIHKLSKQIYKDYIDSNNIKFFDLIKKDVDGIGSGLFYAPIMRNVFSNDIFEHIHKLPHDSVIRDYSFDTHRNAYHLNIANKINNFGKIHHNIKIYNEKDNLVIVNPRLLRSLYKMVCSDRVFRHTMYNNKIVNFFKEKRLTEIIDKGSVSLMRSIYYANLFDTKNDYTIVFFNKYGKNTFEDKVINNITKLPKYSQIVYSSMAASKFRKNLYQDQDELFCDKLQRNNNYISLIQDSVIKHYIVTNFYNTDCPIYKNTKTSFVNMIETYASKKATDANSFTLESFNRKLLLAFENNIGPIQRTVKEMFRNEWEVIYRLYRDTRIIPQQEEYAKILKIVNETYIEAIDVPKLIYFPNDEWIIKKYVDIEINIQPDGIYKLPKDISFHKEENEFLYSFRNVWSTATEQWLKRHSTFTTSVFNQCILDKTNELIANIFPEFNEFNKIIHEVVIPVDEITDWAWVYDEDSPFVDPFKIDELLLPENDTRYEDFEDIIFNRKTLKPRDPVKVLDKNTFIAKFPNHYPIKDYDGKNAYENVAVEYLDVRTGIMRKIFIGFYKLWQDNVFDFAKMTIQQSAKKILDYLYTWILMQFALEDIPEALRVFRLIRWYLECCIIETSEYIVSYEADNLTSGKLNTTTIDIPNDMFPDQKYAENDPIEQNATMFIDTDKHVIRNNPSLLHSSDAHVTFYIENTFETTISFSLHTLTPVSIILNGEIIDTITLPTSSKMVYNIPYTDSFNTFTIYKDKFDNNDTDFLIGNIVIVGMGHTGELDIKFNPVLNGNKILNNTSQKLISYMNLYEDNEELMHELVKGNIHLDVAYDKLCQYWELHHQHKDKGKRLTIKRT